MLEALSAIGLTASAAIVIGFLAYAMAETPRGRITVVGVLTAWFALVVTIGGSAALDPVRGFGVPALGLTVGLPVAALVSAFFAFGPIREAMLAAPLPALVAVNAIRILPGWLFVLLYAADKSRRRSRRAQAGATFSPASRRCPSPGRSFASADASRRSFLRGASSGSQISSTRSPWRPIGAGSASDLRRSADERHYDHPSLAHRSRIPGAEPDFHSRRHCLSAAREDPSFRADLCVARR
jgi:hypothetical protein